MPFNAEDPANSEKIRRLGIVIRPNWKAIEEADEDEPSATKFKYWAINYFSRNDITAGSPGVDAPQVDDAIVVFAKNDADTGDPELWTRHEDDSVTQITKGAANIAPIGFTSNGETSIYGGLLFKYGVTATITGNATAAQTFTDIGLTAFPNNLFTVVITPIASSSSANVQTISTTAFSIKNTSGSRAFNWIAIGN